MEVKFCSVSDSVFLWKNIKLRIDAKYFSFVLSSYCILYSERTLNFCLQMRQLLEVSDSADVYSWLDLADFSLSNLGW